MTLHRSLLTGAWIILLLNLLLAFGTIFLLTRMSPAIARILAANDRSLAACEDVLVVMAKGDLSETPDAEKSLRAAVVVLEKNITEQGEAEEVAILKRGVDGVLRGDRNSAAVVTHSVVRLAAINRQAMIATDIRARRLGKAGAWGAVFLSGASFICGLLFIRYFVNRIFIPLEELYDVLASIRSGDRFRRCASAELSPDFYFIFEQMNSLIDSADLTDRWRTPST